MSGELPPLDVLLARFALQGDTGVRRATFEVATEQVTLFVRAGRLCSACTCGADACEHHAAVLRFLGEDAPAGAVGSVDARLRSSLRPPAPSGLDLSSLADAFDELSLATARAGVSAFDSPSIREALDQLVARAPTPVPLGLARWIGRLNDALVAGEVGKAARLLHGARSWVDELRSSERSAAAVARRRAWLGGGEGQSGETLSESTLIEVGREWLSGLTRTSIERRYLIDLSTGELLREEKRRSDQAISVGPCPRIVQVAFAELDVASRPKRARLLQYTVSPNPSQSHWENVARLAETKVSALGVRYAEAERACPGQAEPFVLFAPTQLDPGSEAVLRDADGQPLLLSDDAGVPLADAVRPASSAGEIAWVSGRILGLSRGLVLRPTSVLLRRDGRLQFRRIT